MMSRRPKLLVVLTDHLRYPPAYESDEPARFRREEMPGQESLRQSGVSFNHHYPIARRAPDTVDWLVWARAFADEIDPLGQPPITRELPEISPEDLQRHLPDGWSAHGPDAHHSQHTVAPQLRP